MKIPCKDCITLAICRHKKIGDLIDICDEASKMIDYMSNDIYIRPRNLVLGNRQRNRLISKRREFYKALQPKTWFIDFDGFVQTVDKNETISIRRRNGVIDENTM